MNCNCFSLVVLVFNEQVMDSSVYLNKFTQVSSVALCICH